MKSLKSIPLTLVGIGFVCGLIVTGVSLYTETQSNASAQKALVSKDVTADVLPPPLFLIEARLVVAQAMDGSLSAGDARR